MKLKYKKVVLGITMGTMCIGFVTFSLLTPSVTAPKAVNAVSQQKDKENSGSDDVAGATVDPTNAPVTNDTVNNFELKENANAKINELVKEYFAASAECNMNQLSKIVTNIHYLDEDNLRNKNELIESYGNIQCYTIEGPVKGTYRVYAYVEVKLIDINTAAPGLNGLYVTTDENGELRICVDQVDEATQDFIKKADESDAVKKLYKTINTKLEESITKDADLKAFYDRLQSATNEQTSNESEGSEEPAQAE